MGRKYVDIRPEYLTKRGWLKTERGWEHPVFETGHWPLADAYDLTREAEDGGTMRIHATIRGDAPGRAQGRDRHQGRPGGQPGASRPTAKPMQSGRQP